MNYPNRPYQAFPKPVPPPSDVNLGEVCLRFDAKWIPYLLGAIHQLCVERTYTEDRERAAREAGNLLATFILAEACPEPEPGGIEMEDCMGCCIRVQNGHLQTFSCGEWQDVPGGDLTALAAGSPQPADGVPQPEAGECENFLGLVVYGQRWRLPVPVSAGDVVTVSDATGAVQGYTTDVVIWRGANGLWSLGGQLIGGTELYDGLNPMPAVPRDALIAWDGTNYYDVSAAADGGSVDITIEPGIVNANLMFMVNMNNDVGTGDFGFQTMICKADAPSAFSHVFDFRTANGGWLGITDASVTPTWTPGTGWVGANFTNGGCGGPDDAVQDEIHKVMPATRFLDSIRIIGSTSTDNGFGNGARDLVVDGGSATSLGLDASVGAFDVTMPLGLSVASDLQIRINSVCFGSPPAVIIQQVIVNGQGTDPF